MNLKDKLKRKIYHKPKTIVLDFGMAYGVMQEETWSKGITEGTPSGGPRAKQHTFMNEESWDEYYNEETTEHN